MAIITTQTLAFRLNLLKGVHNFTLGFNEIWVALYLVSATLDKTTTVYSNSGEVLTGGVYVQGGQALITISGMPQLAGDEGITSFNDSTWVASTITARGCSFYDDTAPGKPSIQHHNFGEDKVTLGEDFTLEMPPAIEGESIIGLGA